MLEKVIIAWKIPEVQKRIKFVLMMFAVFALGAHIPVPGIDVSKLQSLMSNPNSNNLFGLINAFSGGALRRFSMFAMGIAPYINASIVMQMAGLAFPALDAMQKEGEAGRKRIAGITRYLTIVLSIMQALGIIILFRQSSFGINFAEGIVAVVTLTASSMFLLWLGEQVTEYGVGNGVSLVIFAGIMLYLPSLLGGVATQVSQVGFINLLILIASFIAMVVFIIYITQGARRIPVLHFKRVIGRGQTQGGSSYLPVKVNAAGVMPIIFAISLLLLPATILNIFSVPANAAGPIGWLKGHIVLLQPGQTWYATLLYAAMVMIFTFFYTAIIMNVQEIADNLNKYGSLIQGIRPGKPTFDYLEGVVSRVTFAGALFLALIAIAQYVVPSLTGFTGFTLVGGTSLLIVVGVAIETMQAIEAQLLMRNYEGFIR